MMSSKRSADSESTASLSSSMSLGAGPLWWSWCPWATQGRSAAIAAHFPHRTPAVGRCALRQDALHRPAAVHTPWGLQRGLRLFARGRRGETQLSACRRRKYPKNVAAICKYNTFKLNGIDTNNICCSFEFKTMFKKTFFKLSYNVIFELVSVNQ